MEHDHTVKAIDERLSAGPKHNYLRDWIYGGIDGSIATFAVVTGVVGARLSAFVLIIMGMTTTLAEGFAMAAGNFLATRSEQHNIDHLEAIERRHIELAPEGEREEVRQIFAAKGFTGSDLDRAVELITSDQDRWIQTMLTEEYGLPVTAAFRVDGRIRDTQRVYYLWPCAADSVSGRHGKGISHFDRDHGCGFLHHWIDKEPLVDDCVVAIRTVNAIRWRSGRGSGVCGWSAPEAFG